MVSYQTNDVFPFSTLKLGQPSPLQGGGSYFTKITGDDSKILVQMPASQTRAGIVRTRKIAYCDLLYNASDSDFISWIEKLENKCRELIKEKSIWFTSDLEEDDIENMMTPVARMYRSGKSLLIRVHIDQGRGVDAPLKCGFYNDSEEQIDYQKIDASYSVIPLIKVDGIKFSSRSFDIVLKMEQIMVVEDQLIVATCMIKRNVIESEPVNEQIIEEKPIPASEVVVNELDDNIEETSYMESSHKSEVADSVIEQKLGEIEANLEEIELEPDNSDDEEDEGDEEEDDEEDKPEIKPVSVGEEVTIDVEPMEAKENQKIEGIQEIEIETPVDSQEGTIALKRPNEVYFEIYKAAREKAKEMKKAAMAAFLEAQQIKTKYMLDEIEDSDDELEVSST